jgi:hypothetical protein
MTLKCETTVVHEESTRTASNLVQACCGLAVCCLLSATLAQEPPAKAIQDNSFLVEEAYNQEPGVVQHIFNALYSRSGGDHALDLAFTQEWPLFSQRHQISYTVPYGFVEPNGEWNKGVGDVLLNYRLQALFENGHTPAFAPRVSLILPTGDSDKGFGNDAFGGQINLPVSKVLNDRWTVHANVGATILADVNGHDLTSCNVGASAIYAVTPDLNLMIECVGNFDEEMNDLGGTDRTSSVVLSPGLRYAFNYQNDAQMVIGMAAPVGVTSDAPDYGVFFYFSFEHAFMRTNGTRSGAK